MTEALKLIDLSKTFPVGRSLFGRSRYSAKTRLYATQPNACFSS